MEMLFCFIVTVTIPNVVVVIIMIATAAVAVAIPQMRYESKLPTFAAQAMPEISLEGPAA